MTNLQLAYSEHLENVRSHKAREAIDSADVAEKVRHDVVSEELTKADQYLQKYINDQKRLTEVQVQKMKNDTDVLLQRMRNQISEQQMAQKQREIDLAYQKYSVEREKIIADTKLTNAKKASEDQKRQADLKAKLLGVIGDNIDTGTKWFKKPENRSALLKAGFKAPLADVGKAIVKQDISNARSLVNGKPVNSPGSGHQR